MPYISSDATKLKIVSGGAIGRRSRAISCARFCTAPANRVRPVPRVRPGKIPKYRSPAIGVRISVNLSYAACCRRAAASKISLSAGNIGGTANCPAFTSTYRWETCYEL